MRIYRVRPASDTKGNFLCKDVVQQYPKDWFEIAYAKIVAGEPLEMKWNWGCKTKKIGDIFPSAAPGLLLSDRAFDAMSRFFTSAAKFKVILDTGEIFLGVEQKNYSIDEVGRDHLFMEYPKHNYSVVTEKFKAAWESHGFIGAAFDEVGVMPDEFFANAKPPHA